MDTEKYKVLLQAVDSGSFSAAAEKLGYTPSGIVHMMNALEAEVGFQLLTRSRKGIRLTQYGEKVAPFIRELVSWDEKLGQILSELRGLATGTITVGTYSSIAVHWLPRVIKAFGDDYPNIKIQLYEGVHQELDRLMDEQKVDFCLYSYQPQNQYEWFSLKKDRMLAVLPAGHPLSGMEAYPISMCVQEKFIMPASGYDYDVVKLLDRYGITPDVRFSTIEAYAALSMVENGLGMSIMNEISTMRIPNDVVLLPLEPEQYTILGIGIPSLKHASPAAQKLVEYLRLMLVQNDGR